MPPCQPGAEREPATEAAAKGGTRRKPRPDVAVEEARQEWYSAAAFSSLLRPPVGSPTRRAAPPSGLGHHAGGRGKPAQWNTARRHARLRWLLKASIWR
jgi:hypothetical protein